MTPASILLLPAPEHREALLGDSPGGGTPPLAYEEDGVWHVARHYDEPEALILRWRGEDDPMGCARVAEVIGSEHRDARPGWWAPARDIASIVDGEMDHLGRVIYLDLDGREVGP